jgi:hypothetical protein
MSSANDVQQTLASPLEERHIDFILEEEFAINPAFLNFFVNLAWQGSTHQEHLAVHPINILPNCFRSVTTLEGESDVLVIYTNPFDQRVAILIENKIGANFQRDQAARYMKRGESGVDQGRWQFFWTCLVAPARYAKENREFSARVTIEDLAAFFDRLESDNRSCFKANVLRNSAAKSSVPGVKNVDAAVTEYHRQYFELAARILQEGGWSPEETPECTSQDSWFRYFHPCLGDTLECIHKPLMGKIQLIFPLAAKETLGSLVSRDERTHLQIGAVGRRGIAVEVAVKKLVGLRSFASTGEVAQIVVEATGALAHLNEFIIENEDALIPFGLVALVRTGGVERDETKVLLKMLEAQLYGLMWARAIQFGSPAGFGFPNLIDAFRDLGTMQGITIPGMAGGFSILVRRLADGSPVVFCQSESRIWGDGMLNEIRFGKMHSEPDSVYESRSFEEWVEERMQLEGNL